MFIYLFIYWARIKKNILDRWFLEMRDQCKVEREYTFYIKYDKHSKKACVTNQCCQTSPELNMYSGQNRSTRSKTTVGNKYCNFKKHDFKVRNKKIIIKIIFWQCLNRHYSVILSQCYYKSSELSMYLEHLILKKKSQKKKNCRRSYPTFQ